MFELFFALFCCWNFAITQISAKTVVAARFPSESSGATLRQTCLSKTEASSPLLARAKASPPSAAAPAWRKRLSPHSQASPAAAPERETRLRRKEAGRRRAELVGNLVWNLVIYKLSEEDDRTDE